MGNLSALKVPDHVSGGHLEVGLHPHHPLAPWAHAVSILTKFPRHAHFWDILQVAVVLNVERLLLTRFLLEVVACTRSPWSAASRGCLQTWQQITRCFGTWQISFGLHICSKTLRPIYLHCFSLCFPFGFFSPAFCKMFFSTPGPHDDGQVGESCQSPQEPSPPSAQTSLINSNWTRSRTICDILKELNYLWLRPNLIRTIKNQ